MPYIIEIYYTAPEDAEREAQISVLATLWNGHLDCRELPDSLGGPVCLTYEFPTLEQAEFVAQKVRLLGEYVEGPYPYSD